jgi:hypothetical protein
MVDFSVRITGNVDETALLGRGFVKPMDRDDGEKLFECPVIDEGLENTEVTEVLATELFLKFPNFFGWGAAILVQGRNFRYQMPKGVFDAGFGGEIQKAKIESGGGLFLDSQSVVKRFATIFAGKIDDKLGKLADKFGIFLLGLNEGTGSFLDRSKDFHEEDGVVGNRGSTAFTDQCRVGDFFLSANFGDGSDNIPSVFGQGVVHGAFRVAAGSVVIDRQSASDV